MSDSDPCKYCTRRHTARFMCDPAKRVLDALLARGMSFNMPTLEFPEDPIVDTTMGHSEGDTLLRQLVVEGATIEAAGVPRPALVFTGRRPDGKPLGRWVFAGDESQIIGVAQLVSRMANMAIRTAAMGRRNG